MEGTYNLTARTAYVADWRDRSSKIDGFRALKVDDKGNRTEAVKPGDVGKSWHIGIIVGVNKDGTGVTASAADSQHGDKVTATAFGFRSTDGSPKDIVVWRHVGGDRTPSTGSIIPKGKWETSTWK